MTMRRERETSKKWRDVTKREVKRRKLHCEERDVMQRNATRSEATQREDLA